MCSEVSKITVEFLKEFIKESDGEVTHEEVLQRKNYLPKNNLKLDQLSTKFQRCLEIIPEDFDNKEAVIIALNTI